MIPGSEGKASAWATVFNLCNSAVGAGVLSFPMAFHLTGWIGGLVLCPIVATIELIPLLILANKVGDTLGPVAATFVAWTELPAFLSSRWLSIIIPSTLIILPLSLLPSMAALAATSTLALAVYSFNIATVASEFISQVGSSIIPAEAEAFHWRFESVKAVPIMIFAYQCHVQSVPIFSEMTSSPRLFPRSKPGSTDPDPRNSNSQDAAAEKQRGVIPVFLITFAQCTVLNIVMGVSGYLLFPVDTQSNILNNFGVDNNLMLVVRILIGFAVALHYPIDLHVTRTAMYDLVCGCLGKVPVQPAPYSSLAQCTVTIWGGSLVLACLVTDLGQVFQVLGGVACTLIIFILPGLMLLFDGRHITLGNVAASGDVHENLNLQPHSHIEESLGTEAAVDRVPLLGGVSAENGASSEKTKSQAHRALEASGDDTGVVGVQGDAIVSAPGVHDPSRTSSSPDCATQVLGWSLVSFGSCIMSLTVYLTVFG